MVAILGFGKQHQDLRANERRQQHPQTQVVNLLLWQAVARRKFDGDQDRAEKSERQKHAVSVNGKLPMWKKFGVHGISRLGALCLCSFVL